MYPQVRLRRNRKYSWLRELTAENSLRVADLVLPIFITEGENVQEEIATLPGIFRYSIDRALIIIEEAHLFGIKMVALFPVIDKSLKSDSADEAYNQENLICKAIRSIKLNNKDIGICADVALDPYTLSGHDGIIKDDDVDNDSTIEALANQALVLAKAGADIVAPSDMMDGRINAIRQLLDTHEFSHVNILAYSAKYNSCFYGPFRDAVKSNKDQYISKATYQIDYRNGNEAMREIEQDIAEGADMIMIKPGMPYLDIITNAKQNFNVNIFAYQVSGEYAMLKYAASHNAINYEQALIESLTAFKRAGASAIFTYGALEAAKIITKNNIKTR